MASAAALGAPIVAVMPIFVMINPLRSCAE